MSSKLDKIFDSISGNNIFKDKGVLRINYTPKTIPHRDKEIESVFSEIKSIAKVKYSIDLKSVDEEQFSEFPLDQKKSLLIEILDKNELYIPLSEIEDADYQVSPKEKELNYAFYKIRDF